ncbi:hypothetical protein ACTDI4_17075 [Mesorhizobium sp. PUT5]|uniref:hypothetical protein n=1 Tax=Mesorhizobium sp. PUT5 TaxID=3454629 RepID=UPI003FA46855
MVDAPERIWAFTWHMYRENLPGTVEYIRADIAASLQEQVETLTKERDQLQKIADSKVISSRNLHTVSAEAAEAERDRWKGEYLNACRDAASFSDDLVKAEADRDRLAAEVTRLKEALREHVTENVWNAYHIGIERDGRWMDGARSEGEWLARELELPDGWNDAALVKSMLPGLVGRIVARAALASMKE